MNARRGPAWLLPALLLLFITVPLIEVWLIVSVGQRIGALPTLAILLGEALLGSWLMRREGAKAWQALNEAFASGKMPTGELADAALVLVGGVALMLPGFLTDVVGLLFLLPLTRPLARKFIGWMVARSAAKHGVQVQTTRSGYASGDVIEGEVVEAPAPDPRPENRPELDRS